MALLEIENLSVTFGHFRAVSNVSLQVEPGEILSVVGESGSGKSVSMLALMGLVGYPGKVEADRLSFDGVDMLGLSARRRRQIIGKDVAMIFQEPMTSLNPCFTVGFQIGETLRLHERLKGSAVKDRTVELLSQVGIPDPASRLSAFPHQLSGGMSQRVMIAMAIACQPKLLIADEPTTALDVTIQARIIDLLLKLQKDTGMALVLITHDMGVVAETAHRVNVMYAGEIVEERTVDALFDNPRHPYAGALLEALPERAQGRRRLPTIAGVVPGPYDRPQGCLFNPRCRHVLDRCRAEHPALETDGEGRLRCFNPLTQKASAA